MNKFISNTRKAFTLFALTAVMTSFSLPGHSMPLTDGSTTPAAPSMTLVAPSIALVAGAHAHDHEHPGSASLADVKYIGAQEDGSLFNVLYNNKTGAKFTVTVLDGEGNRIYQAIYSDRNFNKKYKVLDAGNYGKLIFVIRSFADNSIQRFEVNSNAQVIEDIEVKEVK
jgi:hypothetical protein